MYLLFRGRGHTHGFIREVHTYVKEQVALAFENGNSLKEMQPKKNSALKIHFSPQAANLKAELRLYFEPSP